jgi:hypothetical protein
MRGGFARSKIIAGSVAPCRPYAVKLQEFVRGTWIRFIVKYLFCLLSNLERASGASSQWNFQGRLVRPKKKRPGPRTWCLIHVAPGTRRISPSGTNVRICGGKSLCFSKDLEAWKNYVRNESRQPVTGEELQKHKRTPFLSSIINTTICVQ